MSNIYKVWIIVEKMDGRGHEHIEDLDLPYGAAWETENEGMALRYAKALQSYDPTARDVYEEEEA